TPPFWMSLSGGVLAIISMIVAKRFIKMSIIGVSVAGALFHMIGQILMAMFVLNTETLLYYLPWMMLISVPTGIFTGVVANKMQKMLHDQWSHTEEE
ncbi:MAG: Gx transporter family protein, partial [Candidatus Izemoplasmatales bacterium]|nr:Gx transporter family protein [Candidatus Izemoplasmatales bacterium]